jgi:PAS domain S-box-containing protein
MNASAHCPPENGKEMQTAPPTRTILVAEDDEGLSFLIRKKLEREGFATTAAMNGAQAVALAAETPRALLLLDYKLPDVTAQLVVETLRARGIFTPFIMMTGYGDEKVAVTMMALGARDYIIKDAAFIDRLPPILKRVCVELDSDEKLAQSERSLRENQDLLSQAENVAGMGSWKWDLITRKVTWSAGMFRLFGVDPVGFDGDLEKVIAARVHPDDREAVRQSNAAVLENTTPIPLAYRIVLPDGKERTVWAEGTMQYDAAGTAVALTGYARDVTAEREAHKREELATQVLRLLNQADAKSDMVRDITLLIKLFTGLDAVGVRLREGDDFPYYQTSGFSEAFVEQERHLCTRDHNGNPVRDAQGRVYLECMCGIVLSGRIDPALTWFTEHGSFWTNNAGEFMAEVAAEDKLQRVRNRCGSLGYQSVALIPLRAQSKTIGLLQLNDKRPGMFTPEAIRFYEGIGTSIGINLAQKQATELLREGAERYRQLVDNTDTGFVVIDKHGIVLLANEPYRRIAGIKEGAEIVGRSVMEWTAPDEQEHNANAVALCNKQGFIKDFETVYQHADGTRVHVLINATGQVAPDGEKRLLSFCRNISERKQAEASLRESEDRYKATVSAAYGRGKCAGHL